jgi:TPR repeat protein
MDSVFGDSTLICSYLTSLCLQDGPGVTLDLALMAQYFQLSADQENGDAQFFYAMALLEGKGVPQNSFLTVEYLKQCSEAGDAFCQSWYVNQLWDGD